MQLTHPFRIFLTVLVMCVTFTARSQEAGALIKKVRDKLNTVNNYEATGVMKTAVTFIKVPESNITVYYKRPDKFRIKKDNGITVVPKGGVSINLSSLLAGENYTAVAAGNSSWQSIPVTVVKLLPMAENSEVVVSTLYIDEASLLIRKAVTTTKDNGTYEIEMTYGKYANWGLPDKVVFTFNAKDYKLPKGIAFDYDTGEKPAAPATDKNQKGKVEISYSNYTINKGIADSIFQ